jgi:hypothetical protein
MKKHYRMLQAAFVFALVGVAFFGSYAGCRAGEYPSNPKPRGQEIDILSIFWRWITHDATGFFTIFLCFITGALAVATYLLYQTTRDLARDTKEAGDAARVASAKALEASTRATDTLLTMERPYLTGGGGYLITPKGDLVVNETGEKFFSVDVANYGKTPAYLTGFGVEFAKLRTCKPNKSRSAFHTFTMTCSRQEGTPSWGSDAFPSPEMPRLYTAPSGIGTFGETQTMNFGSFCPLAPILPSPMSRE